MSENFISKVLKRLPNNIHHYYGVKAKKYIEKNFQTPLSVAEIADQLKISPNYLSSLFRQEFGITIIKYTNQLRMQEARKLIKEQKYTIAEIAQRVGLSDTRYLQRLFKKHYGLNFRECIALDNVTIPKVKTEDN